MKTTTQIKTALAAFAILFFVMLPGLSNAQVNVPFTITNHLTCSVDINWYANRFPSPCASNTGGPISLPPGSSITISASDVSGCSLPLSDMFVELVAIGGSSLTPSIMVNSGNQFIHIPTACGGPNSNINWVGGCDCVVIDQ